MTEDEMVGWHHQLNGHEFEQAEWERLSEALGSPRLWVVERDGGVVEVVAEESRAVATGPLSHTLSLTLREARKQQHL